MIQIIPSLNENTKASFVERFRAVSSAETVQLDILDNTFLPVKNFHDADFIASLDPKMDFELHFMTTRVEEKLADWDFSWVKKIIFHLEAESDSEGLIEKIKAMGKEPSVAINPDTDPKKLESFLAMLSNALVMTVQPGPNGSPFTPQSLQSVRILHALAPKLLIEVDGGMNPKTIQLCKNAGANLFVVGSYLKNDLFKQRFTQLEKALV